MPFGPPSVNVYLLAQDGGYLLLDTAMGTNEAFAALDQGLRAIDAGWSQIRKIVVSHLHPDHTGLVPRIAELSRAPVLMSRADAALLDQVTGGPAKAEELLALLLRGGADAKFADLTVASYVRLSQVFPRFEPDEHVADGDTLETTLGAWQAIVTPGHSPGHLCLYNRQHALLFSGDQVIEEITPHINYQPGHDSLGEFLASLERLARLEVRMILPSHGAPFTGLQPWIERTVRHHEDRCRQLEDLLQKGPQTVTQLVASIWPRTLKPFDFQLGFTEILSHLEYLAGRGRAGVTGEPVQTWHSGN